VPNPILYRRILAVMACTPINALDITNLINELTDVQIQGIIDGRLQQRVVEITTIGANTYTKPSDLVFAFVVCIGAGGGGGGGRKGALGTNRTGGGGGAGGAIARRWLTNSQISSIETVTIGTGGTAGSGVTIDTTNGVSGGNGGQTSFNTLVIATGGNGGIGGTQSTSSSGGLSTVITSQTPAQFPLSSGTTAGGNGTNTANPGDGNATGFSLVLGGNGAGGAGSGTGNLSGQGGNGSRTYDYTGTLTGIIAGSNAPSIGTSGTNNQSLQLHVDYVSGIPLNTIGFGTSASGGGSSGIVGTAGGSAGNSGLYGTGGGGGGSTTNDVNILSSGNGSAGAQGCCIIFEYYV
jgi:hypothetical protein